MLECSQVLSGTVAQQSVSEGSQVLSRTVAQQSVLEVSHSLSGTAAHKLTLCLLVFCQLDTNLDRVKPGKKDPQLEKLSHQIAHRQDCRALSKLTVNGEPSSLWALQPLAG